MSADVSDLSLVRRVQRGDKGAFDALVLKYQHKVVKLVMRYVRNPAEAEDIAQEAFIKAYRALPQFRGDSAFYTWLYRIAINTAKNAVVSRDRSPICTVTLSTCSSCSRGRLRCNSAKRPSTCSRARSSSFHLEWRTRSRTGRTSR